MEYISRLKALLNYDVLSSSIDRRKRCRLKIFSDQLIKMLPFLIIRKDLFENQFIAMSFSLLLEIESVKIYPITTQAAIKCTILVEKKNNIFVKCDFKQCFLSKIN